MFAFIAKGRNIDILGYLLFMNNSYYIALKQQILNKVVLTFKRCLRYLRTVNETPIVSQPR